MSDDKTVFPNISPGMEPLISCERCGGEKFRIVLKINGYSRCDGVLKPRYVIDYAECTHCRDRMHFGLPNEDQAELDKARKERGETTQIS